MTAYDVLAAWAALALYSGLCVSVGVVGYAAGYRLNDRLTRKDKS